MPLLPSSDFFVYEHLLGFREELLFPWRREALQARVVISGVQREGERLQQDRSRLVDHGVELFAFLLVR